MAHMRGSVLREIAVPLKGGYQSSRRNWCGPVMDLRVARMVGLML